MKKFMLTEHNEGKVGNQEFDTFEELKNHLIKSDYFSWINDNVYDASEKREIPSFEDVETVKDIELIFNEYDYSWWKMTIKEHHWLEIICKENNTTVYEIAKNAGIDKSILYRVISNNASFGNITNSTTFYIAKGLKMTAHDFIKKYFDRFFEGEK